MQDIEALATLRAMRAEFHAELSEIMEKRTNLSRSKPAVRDRIVILQRRMEAIDHVTVMIELDRSFRHATISPIGS